MSIRAFTLLVTLTNGSCKTAPHGAAAQADFVKAANGSLAKAGWTPQAELKESKRGK